MVAKTKMLVKRKRAGSVPASFFPHLSAIREVNLVDGTGRVRRLLRFSLADGKRRKSRKPAPLPAQCSLPTHANPPHGYCIERCWSERCGGLKSRPTRNSVLD